MKIQINNVHDAVIIEQPTDIYPLLDWCQSRMMGHRDNAKGSVNVGKWSKAIDYLSTLMEEAEEDGFGSHDNIDKIDYI